MHFIVGFEEACNAQQHSLYYIKILDEMKHTHEYISTVTKIPFKKSSQPNPILQAKFTQFNVGFEEAYNTQRHFSLPDSELRGRIWWVYLGLCGSVRD